MAGLSFIPPLMPTLAAEAPQGDGWLYEIKFDGYRTQIIVEAGRGRAFTRNGHDCTERYQPGRLRRGPAVLERDPDGEVINRDAAGRSDFHALRAAIDSRAEDLVLMAFDLLHIDGRDLRQRP